MMRILIHGGDFQNHGDELMYRAIIRRFEIAHPSIRFVASHRCGTYEQRARLGLYQALWPAHANSLSGTIGRWILRRYGDSFGIVGEEQISHVLDCSGYAYGDPWGAGSAEELARSAKRWRASGKKLILLPQAIGPFRNDATRIAFKDAFQYVDLLIARDRESMRHAVDAVQSEDRIRLAPDFTSLLDAPPIQQATQDRIVNIVPNCRMLDKTPPAQSEGYIPMLSRICARLIEAKLTPQILLHSPGEDHPLAAMLQRELGQPLPIVRDADPLQIKSIIRASYALVGSRYHALVGALSQGVPCVGIGWCHKYAELFAEYHCPSSYFFSDAPQAGIDRAIDSLIDPAAHETLRQNICQASAAQKQRSEQMWDDVDAALGLKH